MRVDPDGFTPAQATVPLGQTVAWKVPPGASGPAAVVDASGLGLFDSGPIQPSGSFTHPFGSAGSYPISNGGSGAGGIDVADLLTPKRGTIDTTFMIRWSEKPAKGKLLFDVQMRVPGSDEFVDWVVGSQSPVDQFIPDDGPGIYQFRSTDTKHRRPDHGVVAASVDLRPGLIHPPPRTHEPHACRRRWYLFTTCRPSA